LKLLKTIFMMLVQAIERASKRWAFVTVNQNSPCCFADTQNYVTDAGRQQIFAQNVARTIRRHRNQSI